MYFHILIYFYKRKKDEQIFWHIYRTVSVDSLFFLMCFQAKKKKFRKILCDCFFFCYIFIYFFCYFSVGFFTVRKSEIIFLIYAYFVAEKKFFSSHLPSPLNGILMFLTIYIIFSTF